MNSDSRAIFLSDPLSEATIKRRRNTLLISGIGIFTYYSKTFPSKINTFGLEFADKDHSLFLNTISILIAYLVFTYIFSLIQDVAKWWISYNKYLVQEELDRHQKGILDSYGVETSIQRFLPNHGNIMSMAHKEKMEDKQKEIVEEAEHRLENKLSYYKWIHKLVIGFRVILDFIVPVTVAFLSIYYMQSMK